MKKTTFIIAFAALMCGEIFAGGLMTNTNQSASFNRNPSRGASLDLDAVYFNPAGLGFLTNGFHLSLNNQTIFQNRVIETTAPGLNVTQFNGKVSAPIFPSVYAVYKMDNLAFSFGFNPIGGGGGAKYDEGLPSFERQIAGIARALTANNIPTTRYSHDVQFEGSSLFLGFQGALTYKVSEMLSLSAGVRYVSAKNTYVGYLKDIKINPNQPAFGAQFNGINMVAAPVFFTAASQTLAGWATGATQYVAGLQPIITGGGGSVLLANGTTVGLTAAQVQQIQGLIQAAGQNPAGVTIAQAQGILNAAAPVFSVTSAVMANNAAMSQDIEVDAKQTGSGFAPLFGFTFKPSEDLVIGFKYEHKTPLTLKTATVVDGTGMFPNGKEVSNDMPSMFSLGVGYQVSPKLKLSGTGHYYLDRSANYGKEINNVAVANTEVIDRNFWEAAFGLEYQLNSELMISMGYLRTQTGVNEKYQSDLSHSLNTNTLAGGFRYSFSNKTALNLGVMNTWYSPDTKAFTGFTDTYKRSAFVFGFGVDFSL